MYKLLKKSDDPKLKDFVGRTVNVHSRADGDYEGIFNNEKIIVPKECITRSKAEDGVKNLIDLFVKGRERLEKKYGVAQCVSQYKLTYEGPQKDGTIGITMFTNAEARFLHHDAIITLSRLYNLPYKEVFEKVSNALAPKPDSKPQEPIDVEAEVVPEDAPTLKAEPVKEGEPVLDETPQPKEE